MNLIYLIMLAFLFANALSTKKDGRPSSDPTIFQAAFCTPLATIPTREPFLAAEEKTRAMPFADGVKGKGCKMGKATGSRLPRFGRPLTLPWKWKWKPWFWGS
jgi:hypothetical protein